MKKLKHSSSIIYASLLCIFSWYIYDISNGSTDDLSISTKINVSIANNVQEQLDAAVNANNDDESDLIIKQLLSKAFHYSADGKPEDSIEQYKKILERNPNHQISAINIALLSKRTSGCELAENHIEHAVTISRGSRLAKALSLLGSCLIEKKEYTLAIEKLERAIEFRPNHSIIWQKLARAQNLGLQPINQVFTTYSRALSLAPNNNELRLKLAKLQHQHLDFNASIATLKNKYSKIRTNYYAQKLLAWNYLELSKNNNAKKHIQLAIRLKKSNRDFLSAMLLTADKQFNSSIELIKSIKKRNPSHHYLLSLNYQAKNWPKSAHRSLDKLNSITEYQYKIPLQRLDTDRKSLSYADKMKALTLLSTQRVSINHIAYIAAQLAFKNQEIIQAKYWIEKLPLPNHYQKINILYSQILWQNKEHQDSLDFLAALHSNHPKSTIISRNYAKKLYKNNQFEQANNIFEMLSVSDYKIVDHITAAKTYLALNKADQALLLLSEAIDYWPNDIEIRYLLAQVLLENNQPERSKQQIQLILKLNNKHNLAQLFLQEHFHEQTL